MAPIHNAIFHIAGNSSLTIKCFLPELEQSHIMMLNKNDVKRNKRVSVLLNVILK